MKPPKKVSSEIAACVRAALNDYFADLDGHPPQGRLYEMVMTEVEHPLLQAIMRHTEGNQSRAAEILGINRGTLRKKLERLGLNR